MKNFLIRAAKKILEIISDPSGQLSNMRFNTTVVTLTICFCIIWMTVVQHVNMEASFVFLLAIAMTGKAAQRRFENSSIQAQSPSAAAPADSPAAAVDSSSVIPAEAGIHSEAPDGN